MREIETSLGVVRVAYVVEKRDMILHERRVQNYAGDWSCEIDVANPKGGALWTMRWLQDGDDSRVWRMQGARKGSDAGFRFVNRGGSWDAVLNRIRVECVPAVQAWSMTEDAQQERRETERRMLHAMRSQATGRITQAQETIAEANREIAAIDLWLNDYAVEGAA